MQPDSNPPVRFVPTNPRTSSLTQREINEIHRAGDLASWRDGLTIMDCPYRRDEATGEGYDPERAAAWITGHSAGVTDLRLHRAGVELPADAGLYPPPSGAPTPTEAP